MKQTRKENDDDWKGLLPTFLLIFLFIVLPTICLVISSLIYGQR